VIAIVVCLARFDRRGRNRANGPGTNRRGLGRFLGGRGRGPSTSGHAAGGLGARGGRRGLGGLLGGRGRGTSTGGGNGTGRGRGLAGRLAGRFGGRDPGSSRGGRGSGLGSLFGSGGRGSGSGRGTGSGSGGLFGSGGRGTGSGSGRGTGNGRGWDLFGGHDNGKGKGKDKDKDLRGIFTRAAEEIKKGWDAGAPKEKPDNTKPDVDDTDVDDTDVDDTDVDDTNETTDNPAGKDVPDTPATPQGGQTIMVKTHGTPSLQAWGRCLPTVEDVILEKQRELRRTEADLEDIAQAIVRLQNQGEQELPASPKLTALLDDIQASLKKLPKVSEALGKIAGNANALPPLYRAEHADDEDRLAGMRGGVEREKRADVGEAQRDT
jgi:hypothetical protein